MQLMAALTSPIKKSESYPMNTALIRAMHGLASIVSLALFVAMVLIWAAIIGG